MNAPTRKSAASFGTVNLRTRQLIRQMCSAFNGQTLRRFLNRLLRRRRRRRMIVELDNAQCHHAVLLRPFLHQHIKQLRLLFI